MDKGQQVQSPSSESTLQVDKTNKIGVEKLQKKEQVQNAKCAALQSRTQSKQHATDNREDVTEPTVQKQQEPPSSGNRVQAQEINKAMVTKLPQKQTQAVREVALRLPSGTNIVARGRLMRTDKTFKCKDGLPLGQFYEVLIDFVVDKTVVLPRVEGKPIKLGATVGRSILWPRQNVVQPDGSPLSMPRNVKDN